MVKKKREKRVVGWKENAALPDLNVKNVIAKIDTGANLASIDAADIKIVTRDKVKFVKFKVMKRNNTVRKTSAPLEGYKRIKSSNGDVEKRPYIKTTPLPCVPSSSFITYGGWPTVFNTDSISLDK